MTNWLPITFKIFRIILSIPLLIYAFIFLGVVLEGFLEFQTIFKTSDIFYGLAYVVLGVLVILILVDRSWRLWQKGADLKQIKKWQKNWKITLVATLLFILLYFLRNTTPSLFLYAGAEIGSFFIKIARNAYLFLFEIDLYDYRIALFAWVFQWQFVFAVVELIANKIFKKRT